MHQIIPAPWLACDSVASTCRNTVAFLYHKLVGFFSGRVHLGSVVAMCFCGICIDMFRTISLSQEFHLKTDAFLIVLEKALHLCLDMSNATIPAFPALIFNN